ncbi:hypothetical protein GUITHDRAFT_102578 [Guillardia theta CCMP2712]|uniref:RWP-RK domain-containing protein n=1 Tax=Guillardia theta (strain CCMP2712) TaxID=905079 RepID=L1JTS4_GUITC|nr:hypothetical protein GUITHDRAFT_102578 [Guillardia theta CCMP2712]EKX51966.1 hypothetical protein GUITHDRAFT_102578 [Guillardia theta CCMP2712]|eukprot:XP_005838946.1 hypothetical protein GUITHDRAFT_102578 [Guillardia theta CCMP2712]
MQPDVLDDHQSNPIPTNRSSLMSSSISSMPDILHSLTPSQTSDSFLFDPSAPRNVSYRACAQNLSPPDPAWAPPCPSPWQSDLWTIPFPSTSAALQASLPNALEPSELSYGQCILQNLASSLPATYADIARCWDRLPAAAAAAAASMEEDQSSIRQVSGTSDVRVTLAWTATDTSCFSADVKPTPDHSSLSVAEGPGLEENEDAPAMLDHGLIDRWRETIKQVGEEKDGSEGVVIVLARKGRSEAAARKRVEVTYEMLASHFNKSLVETSRKIVSLLLMCSSLVLTGGRRCLQGIGKSTMKIVCRRLGIHKWPYKHTGKRRRRSQMTEEPVSGLWGGGGDGKDLAN